MHWPASNPEVLKAGGMSAQLGRRLGQGVFASALDVVGRVCGDEAPSLWTISVPACPVVSPLREGKGPILWHHLITQPFVVQADKMIALLAASATVAAGYPNALNEDAATEHDGPVSRSLLRDLLGEIRKTAQEQASFPPAPVICSLEQRGPHP